MVDVFVVVADVVCNSDGVVVVEGGGYLVVVAC